MQFKTEKIENEYNSTMIHPRLKKLLEFVNLLSVLYYSKEVTVTELCRTQEEQDNIYKNNPEYIKKPWKSVHQYGRGADLRVHGYTREQLDKITEILNGISYNAARTHKTAQIHDVGQGLHWHCQVDV